MAFSPGPITPNIAPQLMLQGAQAQGQMYANLGKSLGEGIEGWMDRKEKSKEAESTSKALETIIRNEPGLFGFDSGSPEGEDAMEAFLTRGADESAIAWNSKLKNFLGAKITASQIKEAQQQAQARQMQMEEARRKAAQQAALQPQIDLARQSAAGVGGGVLRPEVQDNPFFKTVSQMLQAGVQPTPEVVAEFVSKQAAAGNKSNLLDVEKVRYEGPEGTPWERSIDKRTGRVIAEGPVGRPVLSPKEEAEKESLVGMERGALKRIDERLAAGEKAHENAYKVSTALKLLDDPDVKTGAGQGFVLKAKQLGNLIGYTGPEIQKQEQLQSLLGENMMAGVLQQTKGSVSDKEMEIFDRYSASYGKSNEGNKRILQAVIDAQKRARNVNMLIRDLQTKGKTASQIDRAVEDYMDKHSVWSEDEIKTLPTTTSTFKPIGSVRKPK